MTAAVALIPWGLRSLGPALRAGSFASFASPWRGVRAALGLLTGEPAADTAIKAGAVVLALAVAALFARPLAALVRESVMSGLAAPAKPGPGPATTGPGSGSLGPAMLGPAMLGPAALAGGSVFAIVFAWLVAWPYVLPWYDSLAWAMLAVVPWLPSPWAAMDWLLLARTTILGFGYLPARGITMPAGLGWLRSVVRTDLAPLALLAVLVVLIVVLWPRRTAQTGAGAAV
jgi:hypothetical protein